MGYVFNAIIDSRALLLGARVAEHSDVCVVDLAQGLGLVPVSDELHDRVCAVDGDRMGFWFLAGWLRGRAGRLVMFRAGRLR